MEATLPDIVIEQLDAFNTAFYQGAW